MKLLKNTKWIALVSIATVCLMIFSSCQTTKSSANVKSDIPVSAENTNKKAGTYHAMAEGVTKQCPIKVDDETILTKVEYKEMQHALAYTYLFSTGVYEDMDAQLWDVVQKSVEGVVKEKLKTNHMVTQLRADALTLIYIYKDKNDKELFTVTILPDEY